MDEEVPAFKSPEEEAKFYKALSEKYKMKYKESQQELEEFQESSKELEAELEAQLEQLEAKNKELRTLASRLQMECDTLQEKLAKGQQESHRQISDLQEELGQVKKSREDMYRYIRELEQSNDDLERAKRATVASLEAFETRLNLEIERNAMLESELDEKEALGFMVQRLKDEARDLKQELIIQQSVHKEGGGGGSSVIVFPDNDKKVPCLDSNRLTSEHETQTGKLSALGSNGQTPLTPSARISALNIVGDLLRKVGALESKLASCRNFVKENPRRSEKDELASPATSPVQVRQLSRGNSLTSPQEYIPLTI